MAARRLHYDLMNYGPFVMGAAQGGLQTMPPATAPTAKVLNIGNGSSYPFMATTSGSLVDMRGSFNHASGDARVQYMRLYLEGSVGGDCLRAFTTVNANVDTARGIHASLNFEATAGGSECSGLGLAIGGTLHIPDIASWAPTGTLAAIQAEIYSDGTASDPAGLTELAFIRVANSGGSGKADVDTDAFVFSFQGFTAGSGKLLETGLTAATINAATTAALKIKVGATTYYIPIATATS